LKNLEGTRCKRLPIPALKVPPQKAAIPVLTKCSDGICVVCAMAHTGETEIEHRDYVLSAAERAQKVILCCSRPATENAVLRVNL